MPSEGAPKGAGLSAETTTTTTASPCCCERTATEAAAREAAGASAASLSGAEKVVAKTYDGLSFTKWMFAGSAAGIAEHVAMFPVDTIKTRMQAISVSPGRSPQPGPSQQVGSHVAKALRTIIRGEGVAGLYRGVGAVAIGAGPSHGIYFALYEYMKILLGASNDERHRPLETSIAAAVATIVADAVMTPLDVVKQRLQLAGSPYKGTMDCITSTLRTEGVQAFFKSYNTTIIMNVPFVSIHFATYESCKKLLRKSPEDEGLVTQIIAGGVAGGAAAAATNPLDVVKTRLQTSGTQYNTSSSYAVLKSIVSKEGYGALMQGMRPRIVFHIPAAAISWVTYETCKKFLSV